MCGMVRVIKRPRVGVITMMNIRVVLGCVLVWSLVLVHAASSDDAFSEERVAVDVKCDFSGQGLQSLPDLRDSEHCTELCMCVVW